ncbi:MAG: alpha/beta hydrolase [Peptoniphilaceae bacterium]|nr:alpha/beta hydrolase [Peptoniphilaceae bacterium]MDD7434481.1 alpha/beta hydrolase [Peptoniphilaceae bacterium]MDY3076468.1 alpha/beta hydrolase [Peptoniphilaceae bacterium]MDY4196432.1 alpha/beta hydrolase [Peptoniphilaceae bacterium]MDY5842753.1 alpha/beta hydrolase [Peptoniphilaceae bacterium]
MKNKKHPVMLVVVLLVIFVGSYLASIFHTALGKTKTERISFDTERGTLSGILYMPDGVSEKHPVPCIIVTHGYLNSSEMQDANAIELSRRGYVVLALDMYDHGHSKAIDEYTGSFMQFWPTAMWDAVQYMYEKPYVLKDEKANGIIGVTGHSMGGFSSSMAIYNDEQAFKENGFRKIYACLTMGSDYLRTTPLGITTQVAVNNMGGRIQGKICGQFDEFFFNEEQNTQNTVVKKNYVATKEGKIFLEQENPEPNVWYDTKDGGKRIVYQPYEIHPWNHFSKTSTSHVIDFYTEAFRPFSDSIKQINSSNQIWMYKELFECIALIAFFLLFIPLIMLLIKLPFFDKTVTVLSAPTVSSEQSAAKKMGDLFVTMFSILLPALVYPALMDKDFSSYTMITLTAVGILFAIAGSYGLIRSHKGWEKIASTIVLLSGIGLALLTRLPSFSNLKIFSAPTTNQIVYWALISACFMLLLMSINWLSKNSGNGLVLSSYGLQLSATGIFASFLVALIALVIGYAFLFLIDAIWLVDFRIWTFAIKTFEPNIIVKTLPYLLPFFLYYFVLSVSIFSNTNKESMKGFKGYLYAMLQAAGGIVLYLVFHYGLLFTTGIALYPNQALSSILLMALVPTLCIAACFTRYFYKHTGNVWIPVFLNTMLMTLMTVANTCVYYR